MTKKKLNEKKLQKKIDFEPFDAQQKILDALKDVKDVRMVAGRRFGKSILSAYMAFIRFLKGIRAKKDVRIWIVAPSYELTQKIFNYITKWVGKFSPAMSKWIKTRPPEGGGPIMQDPATGSFIKCKSMDNKTSLLGEELDLVIIDEAARMDKEAWTNYIYPTLDSREGQSVMISTPFGHNFFHQEFLKCKQKEDGASFRFRSKDSPYFSEERWKRAKKLVPHQVFQQEYEASFLPDAAAVFRGIRDIVKDTQADVRKGHYYVMGLDIAKHEDFSVMTVIDKSNNNVVYFDRFTQIEYPFQKKRIAATARRYNNARIIVDSTGVGEPIKDDLHREGLFVDDFNFTGKSKKELVEKLSIFIEQDKIGIPDKDVLIDELEAFGYEFTKAGNVKYHAPQGMHDDCVMSLALAVWGLATSRPKRETAWAKRKKKLKRSQRRAIQDGI